MTAQEFNALPMNQKAVLVAKDVLSQLENKKYNANPGCYIKMYVKPGSAVKETDDVQSNIDNIDECRVCAIGSTIVSAVRLGNSLKFGDIFRWFNKSTESLTIERVDELSKQAVTELMTSIFDPKTLVMMEIAFEGTWGDGSQNYAKEVLGFSDLSEDERDYCYKFHHSYLHDDKSRMIKIFSNIIANNGRFRPQKEKYETE